jgi:hypothetical protein
MQSPICESASNLDPWRSRCNALHSNNFREKRGGHGWTPIEHARNKQFRFCFNDLELNRSGVQVGRRFTPIRSGARREFLATFLRGRSKSNTSVVGNAVGTSIFRGDEAVFLSLQGCIVRACADRLRSSHSKSASSSTRVRAPARATP